MDPMRWKQFFTPVKSFDAIEAATYMDRHPADAYTLLDVRQPSEYESGHIPGAKLIPLPDVSERLAEIDFDKPVIVYCAVGGRSRVAAQMLAGKGVREVFNLSGGIKAWNNKTAVGAEDLGLNLFSGNESAEETLLAAYSLEEGLREFYLSMSSRVRNREARRLFEKLSAIELKHQDRIFDEYIQLTGAVIKREEFARQTVATATEGGLTTEEYLQLYQPNMEAVEDVVSLAMAIEAQALDLYQRAADRADSGRTRTVLSQIADEERAHLTQLGRLFD
jgi:rhodanese-related sulfurtransferase/rubrerythrin